MASPRIMNDELVFDFFKEFSKAEFILKHAGFLLGNESKVDADWDGFAASLSDDFYNDDVAAQGAAEYLFTNPPMKQIKTADGRLGWTRDDVADSDRSSKRLFVLVRRVRNNLFHGGKFPVGLVEDAARDERLLEASLRVLRFGLNRCDRLPAPN